MVKAPPAQPTFVPAMGNAPPRIVCSRGMMKKVSDRLAKPTVARLTQEVYIFRDSVGFLDEGVVIEKVDGGAVFEIECQVKTAKGWEDSTRLRKVPISRIICRKADFDARIPIYDKLFGGKLIGLGPVRGTEPADLFTQEPATA